MVYIDGMLDGLDPNSLVALQALLDTRHVTAAAARLGVTQSSMSHRLKRLREALGDPLLVRAQGQLVLTPRAEAIAAPLNAALEALARAVATPTPFDPATSRQPVSLAMPDLLAPLLPGLLAELAVVAPHMQVRVTNVPPDLGAALASGAPMLALAPTAFVGEGVMSRSLGSLRFGVAARRGHPLFKKPLTVARWLSYGHVVLRVGNAAPNKVAEALSARGLTRRVAVEVPTFLAGLIVVAGSDLLMNAPASLVREVAHQFGLRSVEAPVALPTVPFALLWHERFQAAQDHRWARERVYALVRRRLMA
jgi:DNA-binding transcriptional LysR family regulator